MYIQSTLKKSAIATLSQQTPAGKLDQELSAGRIPDDVYINPGQEVVEGKPDNGIGLPVGFRSRAIKEARRRNLVSTAVMTPITAAPGALLGSLAFPNAPLVGAAVGAGIGVAMALDFAREFKGTVRVDSDGHVEKRHWHGQPENFERRPEELHTIFHATGVLGDKVDLVPFKTESPVDPELLKQLAGHKERLKSLATQRRLLADLDGKTRYGKPALQLVDAVQARELLGRGKAVHVIDVKVNRDVEHSLSTEAYSGIHHKKALKTYEYTEKELNYQLQPVREIADLIDIGEGKGLPESILGVARDEYEFKQVVYRKQEAAGRTIDKKTDSSFQELREILVGDASRVGQGQRLGAAVKNMVDPSTRGYAITGAVLGTVAGAATGIDPAVGLTLGGFAGHFIGRQAVARGSTGEQAGPLLTRVATGAGMVAGLGLGILAASTGDAHSAMVAAGAVGAFGGMCSGILAGRGKGELGMNLGMSGFTVGGFVGLGLAAAGGGPVASVTLGALGAVAGGCFGYVATRGK